MHIFAGTSPFQTAHEPSEALVLFVTHRDVLPQLLSWWSRSRFELRLMLRCE